MPPPPNLGLLVRFFSQGRGPVDATKGAANALLFRLQVSTLLHRMQHGIEGTGAQLVAMPGKLMDQPLSIKRGFRSVVEDMKADQAFEQILMLHPRHSCSRHGLS